MRLMIAFDNMEWCLLWSTLSVSLVWWEMTAGWSEDVWVVFKLSAWA